MTRQNVKLIKMMMVKAMSEKPSTVRAADPTGEDHRPIVARPGLI
jgi:hypothetical protein